MKKNNVIKASVVVFSTLLSMGCSTSSNAPQVSEDGMQLKVDKRSTIAYKKEGVNFAEYTQVLIQPSQVAFKKNWKRDYNRNQAVLSSRIKDEDVIKIKSSVAKLFDDVFKEEFAKAGDNPVVDKAGTGTLIIKPSIINLDINAPDIQSAARVKTFTSEAGKATLFLELFDGVSGEILARIVDTEIVGNHNNVAWANRVTNTADAKRTIRKWAKKLREEYDRAHGK